MRLRYPLCLVVFVLGLFCLLPAAYADSWLPPKPSVTYESLNGDARFIVTASGRTNSLVGCRGTLLVKNYGANGINYGTSRCKTPCRRSRRS